jgi:hypothetical protein
MFVGAEIITKGCPMSPLKNFFDEENGFIISTEALMLGTIVVIGLLVGIDRIQDSVVQELADFASAIGILDQSFTYTGVAAGASSTDGSESEDAADGYDNVPLNLGNPASDE